MSSKAYQSFKANRQDVNLLWHAQIEMFGKKGKLTAKYEVINRAAVVLAIAFWEAYLEDLIEESFYILLDNPQGSKIVPKLLKSKISDIILNQPNKLQVWELADNGWRVLLEEHKQNILKDRLSSFHSPKSDKVKALFDDLLGIRDITKYWTTDQLDTAAVRVQLDDFINVRGNIAHRVKHKTPISKVSVKIGLQLIEELVVLTDTATYIHLKDLTGVEPWKSITIKVREISNPLKNEIHSIQQNSGTSELSDDNIPETQTRLIRRIRIPKDMPTT